MPDRRRQRHVERPRHPPQLRGIRLDPLDDVDRDERERRQERRDHDARCQPKPNHICVRNAQMIAGRASQTSSVSLRSARRASTTPDHQADRDAAPSRSRSPGRAEERCEGARGRRRTPRRTPDTSIEKKSKISAGVGKRSIARPPDSSQKTSAAITEATCAHAVRGERAARSAGGRLARAPSGAAPALMPSPPDRQRKTRIAPWPASTNRSIRIDEDRRTRTSRRGSRRSRSRRTLRRICKPTPLDAAEDLGDRLDLPGQRERQPDAREDERDHGRDEHVAQRPAGSCARKRRSSATSLRSMPSRPSATLIATYGIETSATARIGPPTRCRRSPAPSPRR